MGMVGGGRGAFIGAVHRMAANLDGKIELVAGCFSSKAEKSRQSGEDLFLDQSRVYTSYEEMARKEAELPEGQRIDFVSIVAGNNMHFPVSKTFLEAGFHVICEKPVALSLDEAKRLQEIVTETGKVFVLMHNYTGYPMVKEARALVKAGKLGRLLKVVAEYPQGHAMAAFKNGESGKAWKSEAANLGVSNCIGDIGSHTENLARYITGMEIKEVAADLNSFLPERPLDDDGAILVRYENGTRGVFHASQISLGEENNLNIRVYGTDASLEWHQEHPNELILKYHDRPREIWRRGNSYNGTAADNAARLPSGHPEGFIVAFANIYLAAVQAISDHISGAYPRPEGYDFPNIADGVEGMTFIEAVVASSKENSAWKPV